MAETIGVIIGIAFIVIFIIALATKRNKAVKVLSVVLMVFMIISGIIALFKGEYIVTIAVVILLIYGATR